MQQSNNIIILGIDPGIADTGFGVIEKHGSGFIMRECGSITTQKNTPLSERLRLLYTDIKTIIQKYQPNQIGVEELFFAKNTKTALVVAQARGVILLAAAESGRVVREFTPLQVKQALVGYGRAEKHQIQEMVKIQLKLKSIPKPDDAADALAIALCCAQTNERLV